MVSTFLPTSAGVTLRNLEEIKSVLPKMSHKMRKIAIVLSTHSAHAKVFASIADI